MEIKEILEKLRQEYPDTRIRSGKVSWWKRKLYSLAEIRSIERYELRDASGRLAARGQQGATGRHALLRSVCSYHHPQGRWWPWDRQDAYVDHRLVKGGS